MPCRRGRRCCPGGCRRGNGPGRRCRAPRRKAKWQGRRRRVRPSWDSPASSPQQALSPASPRPACPHRRALPLPAFPLSAFPPSPPVFPLPALLPYSALPPVRRSLPLPGYPHPLPFPARYRSAQKRAAVFLRADPYLFRCPSCYHFPHFILGNYTMRANRCQFFLTQKPPLRRETAFPDRHGEPQLFQTRAQRSGSRLRACQKKFLTRSKAVRLRRRRPARGRAAKCTRPPQCQPAYIRSG